MNELQIFKNEEFGQMRSLIINDEPWFVASDICKALDLSNPTMAIQRLDDDERSKFKLGRQGEANIVNEYGLYNLILVSRKPEAKKFKRWVTYEVLPSIRRKGSYSVAPQTYAEALRELANTVEQKEKLKLENQEMKPKALFADAVTTSNETILIGQLAKLLKQNGIRIGQNRLFKWLRDNKYLMTKGSRHNQPTQKSMDLGFFEVKERTINNPDGSIKVTFTTMVTGKGQVYFINKFLKENE